MPQAQTKHFETLDYESDAAITFPAGLPAFEQLTRFLLIEHPPVAPLLFLQSLEEPEVCFLLLPVNDADPNYELSLSSDDLETLGLAGPNDATPGRELGCFAIVSAGPNGATANLAAPIVVCLGSKAGVQAVRSDARYSHQAPFAFQEAACS